MGTSKKSFCIVCIANYCRSPVVERFLKDRFKNKYEFFSAGLSPISLPGMDPRSLNYLEENNIEHGIHSPKKISMKMLKYFDRFLAVDFYVLSQLNISYPKYKHKFVLLTSQFSDLDILDPYLLESDEYKKIMDNIKKVSFNINLEEI